MKKIAPLFACLSLLVGLSSYADVMRPQYYDCANNNIHIIFQQGFNYGQDPDSEGSVFSFNKKVGSPYFSFRNVRLSQSPMGLIASVNYGSAPDHHSSSYSLVIPLIHLKDSRQRQNFKTVLVDTTSKTTLAGPQGVLGVVQENSYSTLDCTASMPLPTHGNL